MTAALSVVFSVYNGQPWVGEAIQSILAQTFEDFEFIVVDDGSTDGTTEVLAAFNDGRLHVIRQDWNGLTRSLNRGLARATAPVIARMDADDVAVADRFAKQLAFLDNHPEVGLLGSGCSEISATGEIVRTVIPPSDDGTLRWTLIRRNPFIHASVMMRREALQAVHGYDESFQVAQDYDLWMRMSRVTRMANLPEPLVKRRLTPDRVSSVRDTDRLRAELRLKMKALRRGAYPLWCAVFLVKPLCGLALPSSLRHLMRRTLLRGKMVRANAI